MPSSSSSQKHESIIDNDLILTKITVPVLKPSRLVRDRLVNRLRDATHRSVTLVTAPAGFGKTTLMAEWAGRSVGTVAWVQLNENDNELVRFWTYLTAALQRAAPNVSGTAVRRISLMRQPPFDTLLTPLLGEVAAFRGLLTLFLDDFHEIVDPLIVASFGTFLTMAPENLQIVIGARSSPPLHLSRLRSTGRLQEIRSRQLAFSRKEAVAYLRSSCGEEIPSAAIDLVARKADGWPVALQIGAFGLKDSGDPEAFAETFSGQHRHILDYLRDEVLTGLSPTIRDFLIRTSFMDRFNAELCDAVTGKTNSAPLIQELDDTNLFLVPTDDTRTWFRYHRLFREVLEQHLEDSLPNELPRLRDRASRWFEQNGLIEEAVNQAIASEDWDRVVGLIEPIATELLTTNNAGLLQRWASRLPRRALENAPRLSVRLARAVLADNLYEDYEAYLRGPERIARATGDRQLLGQVLQVRAMALQHRNHLEEAADLARHSLEVFAPDDLTYRGVSKRILGVSLFLNDKPNEADPILIESYEDSVAANNLFTACAALSSRSVVMSRRGEICEGLKLVAQAEELVRSKMYAPVVHISLARARLLFDKLDTSGASRSFGEVEGLCDQTGYRVFAAAVRILEARLRWVIGEVGAADRLLDQARSLILSIGGAPDVTSLDTVIARMHFASGQWEAFDNWARSSHNSGPVRKYDRASLMTRSQIWQAVRTGDQHNAHRHIDRLRDLGQLARKDGRGADCVDSWIGQAVAQFHIGQVDIAVCSLNAALSISEAGGLLRPYSEEGPMIVPLLKVARSRVASAPIIDRLLSLPMFRDSSDDSSSALSPRESEILGLLAQGFQNHEIANKLILSENTIKTHLRNVYTKLGSKNRTEAVSKARELSLI